MRISTDQNSLYSRGLSSEGFAGGYYACLCDIQLVLNGIIPQKRFDHNIWE